MQKAVKIPARLPCWDLWPNKENHLEPLQLPGCLHCLGQDVIPSTPVPCNSSVTCLVLPVKVFQLSQQPCVWQRCDSPRSPLSPGWGHPSLAVCNPPSPPPDLNTLANLRPGDQNYAYDLTFLHIFFKIQVHSWWRNWSEAKTY